MVLVEEAEIADYVAINELNDRARLAYDRQWRKYIQLRQSYRLAR